MTLRRGWVLLHRRSALLQWPHKKQQCSTTAKAYCERNRRLPSKRRLDNAFLACQRSRRLLVMRVFSSTGSPRYAGTLGPCCSAPCAFRHRRVFSFVWILLLPVLRAHGAKPKEQSLRVQLLAPSAFENRFWRKNSCRLPIDAAIVTTRGEVSFPLTTYKTYVRPILEYVEVEWGPFQNYCTNQLKRLQKIARDSFIINADAGIRDLACTRNLNPPSSTYGAKSID